MGLAYHKPYVLTVYIWIYCLVWWWIQDFFKVILMYNVVKHNIFQYNDTGEVSFPESTRKYIETHKAADMERGKKPGGHH